MNSSLQADPDVVGLSIDRDGNLYLTAIEGTTVGVTSATDRKYREYAGHPEMVWPDGVSYSPAGYMYVSAAQVSRAAAFNEGIARNKAPYGIFRFRPLVAGRPGY